jgi:hypothetical protein
MHVKNQDIEKISTIGHSLNHNQVVNGANI